MSITVCDSPPALSIASGINPNNAAVRRVPVAKEINIEINDFWIFSANNTKIAAAEIAPILLKRLNKIIHIRIFYSPNNSKLIIKMMNS